MDNEEGSLKKQCAMVMVKLPLKIRQQNDAAQGGIPAEQASKVQPWLCETLVRRYGTFIAVIFYRNEWWVRFSAQIYLELEDFKWGGQILKVLCEEIANGLLKEPE